MDRLPGGALGIGLPANLGGITIADVRGQRGDQQQRLVQQRGGAVAVGLDADNAAVGEAARRIGQQADRLQHVADVAARAGSHPRGPKHVGIQAFPADRRLRIVCEPKRREP